MENRITHKTRKIYKKQHKKTLISLTKFFFANFIKFSMVKHKKCFFSGEQLYYNNKWKFMQISSFLLRQ